MRRNFVLLSVVVVLLIIYGSLFPFQFFASAGNPLGFLRSTWDQFPSRGDLLANILLYLPLGFFAAGSLLNFSLWPRIVLVTTCGLLLSVGMELAQFYDIGRQCSMSDVYANTAGAFLGAFAGSLLGEEISWAGFGRLRRRPFLGLLLACWAGYRLFPYVPVINLHKYWHAVRPLITDRSVSLADGYRHMAIWLAVAEMLEELAGVAWKRVAIWGALVAVTLARILILGIVLSRAEIAGGLVAAALWSLLLVHRRAQAPIIAVVFAVGVALQGLAPFHFISTPHAMVWIPFAGFLSGSLELNVLSFFEKVFLYGALVWLAVRAGIRWRLATVLGCLLVFCIRLGQAYLPDRSADMTDVVLLLLVSAAAQLMGESPGRRRPTNPASSAGKRDGTFLRIGNVLILNDAVQPADLILVLAGRMERKAYGLQLYRAGIAPRLVLSVGRFEVSKMRGLGLEGTEDLIAVRDATPPDERHFLVQVRSSGVQIEKLRLPRWSTYGEALGLRAFLEKQAVDRVLVISTDIHLRRVALSFRKAFQGTRFEFVYCPVPRAAQWQQADFHYLIQELFKLAGYRALLSLPPRAARRLMQLK